MTTRFLAAVALVTGMMASIPAEEEKGSGDGWIPLFNGKDFTGWKIPNPPSGELKSVTAEKNSDGKVVAFIGETKKGKKVTLWQVKDGMIVGGGPASHIFTEVEADDFHYRVEAKINDKGNSGQYFRTKFEPGFPRGYEAQINATHSDRIRTGSLYPDYRTKLGAHRKEICVMDTAPHKPDEFFTQEVIAEGDRIRILVNGKQTVDFKDPYRTHLKGHFALQGHDPGSVMTFRKVEYRPIKRADK
jgi:hypothetical protein